MRKQLQVENVTISILSYIAFTIICLIDIFNCVVFLDELK